MKKRFLYSLLFGIPGFFCLGIIALIIFGATVGILWIFIFGDNPWPSSTEPVLSALVGSTFLLLWLAFTRVGYAVGKKLEKRPNVNWTHILASACLTLVLVLFLVLQQLSAGNLGPKSDGMLCSDFCVQHGYSGSSLPARDSGDRTCSCYDHSGKEALTLPLDDIDSGASR